MKSVACVTRIESLESRTKSTCCTKREYYIYIYFPVHVLLSHEFYSSSCFTIYLRRLITLVARVIYEIGLTSIKVGAIFFLFRAKKVYYFFFFREQETLNIIILRILIFANTKILMVINSFFLVFLSSIQCHFCLLYLLSSIV